MVLRLIDSPTVSHMLSGSDQFEIKQLNEMLLPK